jgi:rubrerythrin
MSESIDQLFEMAIAAEKASEALYHGLQRKFAFNPELAAFWERYAIEEAGHAMWLTRLRDRADPAQLSAPADPLLLRDVRKALVLGVDRRLEGVKDLNDAYELVNELENSETNAIFDFLITNFAEDEEAVAFMRAQLAEHIGRLVHGFPAAFRSAGRRREVKALDSTG